ncbi:NTF2-like protein [Durotheca rogersii]|uniref:NTF2-like protein n=1 Tax=Durotheca rogersii TaxID=419775 RepID=UPI0022203433|nr:NTF2-like protein [Durotheca rogersii]KAI5867102.1 NTF2-like protein [Durotheca rogersii]
MAPSGPRKGPASSGPQGARGPGSNGAKTTTRDRISKRRSNQAKRLDRDGDLDMEGPGAANGSSRKPKRANDPSTHGLASRATRPSGTGSRAPRPTTKAQQIIQRVITGGSGSLSSRIANGVSGGANAFKGQQINASQTMVLRVEGLKSSKAASNEGGGLKELLIFLERKAQTVGKATRPIKIKKSQINGDFVYVTASKEDGEEILKLNGFGFAGSVLAITESPHTLVSGGEAAMSSNALEIKEQLRSVLSVRYDVGAKLLNLSALGEDTVLNQMGVFHGQSTPEKLFRALMAVCDGLFKTSQEKRDAVVSISLSNNNIDDVLQIMALTETFPDLVNLDLSHNHFKDLKGLQKWRYRLGSLQALLLNGNPIETLNPNYKADITAWFPKLQNLSGTLVRTPEQVAAEEAASRPTPIPQHGADFRDINCVGEGFLGEFLTMYDTDRHGLAAKYYDDQSSFSISVNSQSPHPPDIQPPGWGAYIKFSRNHTKITHTQPRIQRLFSGTNLIQSVWQQLPPTRHPNLTAELDKYIIDCHPIHGLSDPTRPGPSSVDGMVITMHGEFQDQEPGTLKTARRSFSRTFVLGPGVPSRNPIRVISDTLVVRVFSPLPTSTPEQGTRPSEEIQKQQMVVELCKGTGMTQEYSRLCLDGANWNFDQALASFNEKRAQLPPEAFGPA